ncbi:MAG: hypothetical protein CMI90_06890 [Pelagibacteraceae bacterium]|nr:hypothetical protein [Pelagibacteraceae bacterium]|tara:strand:- start:986 stop:1447 length:462 start_codon:yes stop_codon:yes gene_type:complete
MTKTKQIISIEYSLKEILSNLSDEDIKDIIGKTKSYLYKCADPDNDVHHIHFKDVLELEKAMIKFKNKTPFSNLFKDYISVNEDNVKDQKDILNEVVNLGGRLGDLMDQVRISQDEKSSGGVKIVPHEKENIYNEIQKVDNELIKIKSKLKSM